MSNSGNKTFNKFKSFLKNNGKLLLIFCSLSLINIFFLCWNFSSNGIGFNTPFIIMLGSSILIEIALCVIITYAKRKNWKIEKTFLILGLIIGSLYCLALPIGRAPDEESHFFRVYEITEGHFVSDITEDGNGAGSLEASNIEIVRNFSKQNITYNALSDYLDDQPSEQQSFVVTSADGYNIISYLPQSTGMFIGKIFHLPFLVSAYLARFFNLIFCMIILYFSIKYIPFLKNFIFFITFLPISMQSMASLSADAPITVTSIALISFILYATYSMKTTFNKKHFFILLFLCIFVSISKIVYAPLCFLLFTIPKARFGKSNKKYLWIFSIGAIVLTIYLIWHFVSPPLRTVSDSSTQISLILHNPFWFLSIIIRSISANSMLYLSGALGGYLEWFNITLSMLYILASAVIFILLCTKEAQVATISKSFKILSASIFALIVLLTFTAFFISWTKTGETIIDGVQGRYFLPIMLLIPTWFLPTHKNKSITKAKDTPSEKKQLKFSQNYYLYAFFIFESIYAISSIICSHL